MFIKAWQPGHLQYPSELFVSGSRDFTSKIWNANTHQC